MTRVLKEKCTESSPCCKTDNPFQKLDGIEDATISEIYAELGFSAIELLFSDNLKWEKLVNDVRRE